jgi:predicted phosphodiesterase
MIFFSVSAISWTMVPSRREAIRWVRERALRVIRGNHDHALGYGVDCRCAPVVQEASITTRRWHSALLSQEDKQYLRDLPITEYLELAGAKIYLAHASPTGDLYEYHIVPNISDEALVNEIQRIVADFIFLGHTHLPLLRVIGKTTILNPGSIGQPRHGDSRASYAIWDDGEIEFVRGVYEVDQTTALLEQAPLPSQVITQLSTVLRSGGAKGY